MMYSDMPWPPWRNAVLIRRDGEFENNAILDLLRLVVVGQFPVAKTERVQFLVYPATVFSNSSRNTVAAYPAPSSTTMACLNHSNDFFVLLHRRNGAGTEQGNALGEPAPAFGQHVDQTIQFVKFLYVRRQVRGALFWIKIFASGRLQESANLPCAETAFNQVLDLPDDFHGLQRIIAVTVSQAL
jgi:hypothetical protein